MAAVKMAAMLMALCLAGATVAHADEDFCHLDTDARANAAREFIISPYANIILVRAIGCRCGIRVSVDKRELIEKTVAPHCQPDSVFAQTVERFIDDAIKMHRPTVNEKLIGERDVAESLALMDQVITEVGGCDQLQEFLDMRLRMHAPGYALRNGD